MTVTYHDEYAEGDIRQQARVRALVAAVASALGSDWQFSTSGQTRNGDTPAVHIDATAPDGFAISAVYAIVGLSDANLVGIARRIAATIVSQLEESRVEVGRPFSRGRSW